MRRETGLFTSIGTTIAQGINSALTFIDSAIENFDWDSLGTAIVDLVTGALDNLDWPLIKRTVLNALHTFRNYYT